MILPNMAPNRAAARVIDMAVDLEKKHKIEQFSFVGSTTIITEHQSEKVRLQDNQER